MNAFFSFDLFMVFITDTRYYSLSLGCSSISLRELCNNQQPRCDIAWLHATNYLYHVFRIKRLNNLTLRVRLLTI